MDRLRSLHLCPNCSHIYEYDLNHSILIAFDDITVDSQNIFCSCIQRQEIHKIMAKPAFIYAFDNLSPERFTELCGLLLAERHKGFLLGGVGPDGGVDGEVENILGQWTPETESPLENKLVKPGQSIIFQFKHKVVGRLGGQSKARQDLLTLYKDSPRKPSELKRSLVMEKKPDVYVLVTNVEINAPFRSTFIEECRGIDHSIKDFQIIGLDELELWITMNKTLRHLYFPTIFGAPRFYLKVKVEAGFIDPGTEVLIVSVLNIGELTSYIRSVDIKVLVDEEEMKLIFNPYNIPLMGALNPKPGASIEPGRKLSYYFPLPELKKGLQQDNAFPVEVIVNDEIDNTYRGEIDNDLRMWMSR